MTTRKKSEPTTQHLPTHTAEYIRELLSDATRLRETLDNGRAEAARLIEHIRSVITPTTGIGMLHSMAMAELARNAKQSVEATPSDLCGQARFLRGLVTSGALSPDGVAASGEEMQSAWRETTRSVEQLWMTLFFVERLHGELLRQSAPADRQQIDDANMAWSHGRTDIDVGYVDHAEERCREVFRALDRELVTPTFGVGVDRMLQGFPHLLERMQERMEIAVKARKQNGGPLAKLAGQLGECLEFTADDLPATWSAPERAGFMKGKSGIGASSSSATGPAASTW